MPETKDGKHRIPVAECKITATIELSREKGISALYCGGEKKIATYLFDTDHWSMESARAWVKARSTHAESEMQIGKKKDLDGTSTICRCPDPECGYEGEKEADTLCSEMNCPECGATLEKKPPSEERESVTPTYLSLSLPAAERVVSGDLSRIIHMGDLEEITSYPIHLMCEGKVYAEVKLSQSVHIGSDIYAYEVEVMEVYDPPLETYDSEEEAIQEVKNVPESTSLVERVSWRLPPFSSEGGNYFLAPTIRDLFPPHETFVETYCGSSNVLFSTYPVSTEVLNDTDAELISAYESMRALTLRQLIELRGKNWHPWKAKFESLKGLISEDEVNQLYRFLYLSWYSFDSNRKDYRGRPKNWSLEARLGRVENARVRLREVKLTSEDGVSCIERWDSPSTAFFLDPPFTQGSNINSLREALPSIEGKFVLRISDTPEHRNMLSEYNVMSTSVARRAGRVTPREDGRERRAELLVTNCDLPSELEKGSI